MPVSKLVVCHRLIEMLATLLDAWLLMWPWEAIAVIALIAYLLLAIRQNVLCWAAAIFGTSIYLVLTFRLGLYMEAALQVFYLAMAVYGWYHWAKGVDPGHVLPVVSWPIAFHALLILLISFLTLLSGYLLSNYSDASLPYIDSFTTWGAVFATWMVARKVLENWHYWFAIDAVSVFMYFSKGLVLTALLYVVYLVLIIFGLRAWRETRVL
jgi:nicotinamide mononucleotide transporter